MSDSGNEGKAGGQVTFRAKSRKVLVTADQGSEQETLFVEPR